MENYLLVNNYGKSNTPDRIYYIMRRSDLPNLIKEESVVFGDKAYILEEGTMMFMGNDGIWYDTEGEVPVITAKELNVTQNGTYADPDPYVAYRPVNVQVTDYNVEGLNVTENGTYSESGKAYSPVVVNVPLPENAYLKKDLPTGAIATVTDAEAEIMPSLKIAITPVQSGSGDPSPDNIRPISGWTEAVIYNSADVNFDADGNIVIESTQEGSGDPSPTNIRPITAGLSLLMDDSSTLDVYGGYLDVKSRVLTVNQLRRKLNDTLTDVSIVSSGENQYFRIDTMNVQRYGLICDKIKDALIYGATTETGINVVKPSSQSAYRVVVRPPNVKGMTVNGFRNYINSLGDVYIVAGVATRTYQLSQTEFARALTALGISTTEISFGSAGTVYGGTLDVTNGVLTVTDGYVADLGSLTWTTAGSGRHNASILDAKIFPNVQVARAKCEQYKTISANSISDNDYSFCLGVNNLATIQINDSRYNGESASDFKEHMSGTKLVYELATPKTYQLTPTEVQMLLGTNNIWADTGDILEGKYWSKNPITVTQTMLSTLRSAGEITEITPEELEEPEEPEESDER